MFLQKEDIPVSMVWKEQDNLFYMDYKDNYQFVINKENSKLIVYVFENRKWKIILENYYEDIGSAMNGASCFCETL